MERRREQMRMYLQALRNGWNVPAETRAKVMELVRSVLEDPAATERERKTANLCLEADQQRADKV